jgi:glycosyltransferase involved in cell wall biosynthesis
MLMAILFWGSVLFVVYAYAGYAACLWGLTRVRRRPVRAADVTPAVSFIITVHNEAKRISAKLENTLAQDYPADRLEIVVASDCSTDETDHIVRSYADRGVRLIRAAERRGKEHAQKLAVEHASGEILVFSDVATELDPGGIRHIVRNFSDATVGCVSSVDRMIGTDGRPTGEGGYVKYEMRLRQLETEIGSVVGLSGSFFAARRSICMPWPVDVPSDFTIVFNAVSRGLRGISDPRSVGYYRDLADPSREYARKVRTVVRGVSGLLKHRTLLNPFRYGIFAWQLASHKLCRWLVPFAMLIAAASNLLLAREPGLYRWLLVIQALFYGLAVLAIRWPTRALQVWRPVGFLVLANVSILDAWLRLLRGQTAVMWTPSQR